MVDVPVAGEGSEWIGNRTASRNSEVDSRLACYRSPIHLQVAWITAVRIEGGRSRIRDYRLTGRIRIQRQRQRCKLIEISLPGQIGTFAAYIGNGSYCVSCDFLLEVEMPLLHIGPHGLGWDRDDV